MRFEVNGVPTDVTFFSMDYGEARDVMNGIYVDMPETYVYLSDHVEEARELQALLPDDMQHFDLTGCDPDFEQVPHKWVLESVGRMIVRTAEKVCIEACEQ